MRVINETLSDIIDEGATGQNIILLHDSLLSPGLNIPNSANESWTEGFDDDFQLDEEWKELVLAFPNAELTKRAIEKRDLNQTEPFTVVYREGAIQNIDQLLAVVKFSRVFFSED